MTCRAACSPIASISTCTKRLSLEPAARSPRPSVAATGWEAPPSRVSRASLSSHSPASQSLSARAKAAPRFSSRKLCTGNRQLQMAWAKPKRSSVAAAVPAGVGVGPCLAPIGAHREGGIGRVGDRIPDIDAAHFHAVAPKFVHLGAEHLRGRQARMDVAVDGALKIRAQARHLIVARDRGSRPLRPKHSAKRQPSPAEGDAASREPATGFARARKVCSGREEPGQRAKAAPGGGRPALSRARAHPPGRSAPATPAEKT